MRLVLPTILLFLIQFASAHEFPQPYDSEPDKEAKPPTAQEAVGMIDLPEGFTATVYASEPDVRNPIAMAWDHKGRMWVAENFTYAERKKRFDLDLRDRILVLHDKDGDGVADEHKVFADNLTMLTSVEVGEGGIWAMCPPRLLFIPDADGDDVPDGDPIVKLDGFTVAKNNYHNFANGLRWGPDGWLYGRCGHSCPGNPGKPGTPEDERIRMEGGIFRYHPTREVVEVICHGTTNPWGHDWDQHGELFFINTVNGHLWHGIPGAHFKESFGSSPNPGVFERLDMHADHWHFDTGQHWTKSRAGAANDFGGGHAHIGMMIYQGDQWPEPMRDKLYTLNMHGLRANVERLERHGSGYVGRHEDDVFLTKDQWFRGIDIRQGPDGSAYVLDWSDTGECHDSTGVHRSSGRIYRISHGTPPKPELTDLEKITPEGVVRILKNPNVWYERQLRRRLTSTGKEHAKLLQSVLGDKVPTTTRLRALWALNEIGAATPEVLRPLLDDEDEHIRCWAIRLLTDDQPIDSIMGPMREVDPCAEIDQFVEMAQSDPSGLVRLTLASTLQRIPVATGREPGNFTPRARLAASLLTRKEDAADHNLPSIVWYGLIPLAEVRPNDLAALILVSEWPETARWIARAIAGSKIGEVDYLLHTTQLSKVPAMREAVLQGLLDAYRGQKRVAPLLHWPTFMQDPGDQAELILELSLIFGHKEALDEMKRIVADEKLPDSFRLSALRALIRNPPSDLREICEPLLEEPSFAATAVHGLATFDDPALGEKIAERYDSFDESSRAAVMEVLVSRKEWALSMLDQIEADKIPRADLAAFHARQIRAFGDEALSAKLTEVWGSLRDSPEEKRKLIEDWRKKLTPKVLAAADRSKGRVVFQQVCGACHKMYGEGGAIGPDLTGSGRKDLGYLLENIADPGAVVSKDYRMTTLNLRDGRIITGVIARQNKTSLTLRQIAEETTLDKKSITKRETSEISMMPDGLLQALPEEQIRDLISYLQHKGQVPLPEKE